MDCLVVGAGLSGLLAARTLDDAGFRVLVVDKGRGVGGRMASRRFGGARFDHGAQFFTCREPEFADWLERWTSAGAVTEWCRGFRGEDGEGHSRYRGVPAMTAIAKLVAENVPVLNPARVESLEIADAAAGWTVRFESDRELRCRSVVASAPVPQSLAMLDAGAAVLPVEMRQRLDRVEYAPCIAVMARLSEPSGLTPPGALTLESGPLRWMADNHLKGVSDVPALTLHGSHSFSRDHFEKPDDEVAARLLEAASSHATVNVAEVQVHRWRYSEPIQGPSERCFGTTAPAPLVLCGDAFGGPRVEGAALSGLAAGRRAIELLSMPGA